IHEERPEFLGVYDAVLLFDVLEHIEEPVGFIRSILRHLKTGGVLLVNVPALMSLFSEYDTVAGHYRRYDYALMRKEFQGMPIEWLDMRYWGLSMVPLLLLRKLVLAMKSGGKDIIRTGFI